ncbi:hypothetical protein [Geodermatophilus sp. SYSU D00766]
MDVLHTDVDEDLLVQLDLARVELGEARRARQAEDTPVARQRVVEAMRLIDRLLDRWNDLVRTRV